MFCHIWLDANSSKGFPMAPNARDPVVTSCMVEKSQFPREWILSPYPVGSRSKPYPCLRKPGLDSIEEDKDS